MADTEEAGTTAEPAVEDAPAPDAGPSDEADHAAGLDNLFSDSVYQYLIYFGKDGDTHKDNIGFVLAIITIVLQWVLYGILLGEGQQKLKDDHVNVEVSWGYKCTSAANLKCEANDGNVAYNLLAMVLLSMFLMKDAIEALRGFFHAENPISKVGAVSIMATTGYACFTGGLWAYQGIYNGSNYDAIVNCVGVLFIADVDEKIEGAFALIRQDEHLFDRMCGCCKCFNKCRKTICLVCCCLCFFGICLAAMATGTTASGEFESDGDSYWWWDSSTWSSNDLNPGYDAAAFGGPSGGGLSGGGLDPATMGGGGGTPVPTPYF